MNKLIRFLLAAAVLPVLSFAQTAPQASLSRGAGFFVAYNYGLWNAKIYTGTSATGAASITVYVPTVALPDGRTIVPFAVTAPITVGAGSTAETVTPSAVSNCVKSNPTLGICTITATFSNVHGSGELIQSGTFGLEEAINDANASGGGVVVIDSEWVGAGGVTATVTGNKGFTNVSIIDARGTVSGSAFSFKAASNGANMAATTISWY